MNKNAFARILIFAILFDLVVLVALAREAPGASGCTFSALKSVSITTDPPHPIKGRPFTLNAVLLFGGGMGHGNMLTAARNAVSATLALPDGISLTKGPAHIEMTTPVFSLGYETPFTITWEAVASVSGKQPFGIHVQNTTLGEGQESEVSEDENGLLSWEVVRPSMKDARIESGDKEMIAQASLDLMPSLRSKSWRLLSNDDVLFTNADGTRYSVAAGQLALGPDDPSPVIVSDMEGNKYLASNGFIFVDDGPEVSAPKARPLQPGLKELVKVQARIAGDMAKGKVVLFYSTDGINWQRAEMTRPVPSENVWQGDIPGQDQDGTTVNYYVQVTDGAGKTVTLPRYSLRVVDKDHIANGVRNVVLLTLAHILVAILVVVLWAQWDLSRRRRAAAGANKVLVDGRGPLFPNTWSGILRQRLLATGTDRGYWRIGFYILLIFGILFTIVGIITDQFQIINLIIKMG